MVQLLIESDGFFSHGDGKGYAYALGCSYTVMGRFSHQVIEGCSRWLYTSTPVQLYPVAFNAPPCRWSDTQSNRHCGKSKWVPVLGGTDQIQ